MKKKVAFVLILVIALLLGGVVGFYATMPASQLIVSCTSNASPLPASWACGYAKAFGGLDPNEPVEGDEGITAFAFTMNGYGLRTGDIEFDDQRTLEMLAFFADVGVDFERAHDAGLPPLHNAVLLRIEPVVELLIDAGAPLDTRVSEESHLFDEMTALDTAYFLRGVAGMEEREDHVDELTRLIGLLEEAGAERTIEHVEAQGAIHAQQRGAGHDHGDGHEHGDEEPNH